MFYLSLYLISIVVAFFVMFYCHRELTRINGLNMADALWYAIIALVWPIILIIVTKESKWYKNLGKRINAAGEAFWKIQLIKPKK